MNLHCNLLEIFPEAAFWYQCTHRNSLLDLESLRAVAAQSGASHNEKSSSSRCYYLQGDALWFDFQPQTFDLIARSSNFGIFHSFIIDRKCERWLRSSGIYGVFAPGVRGLIDLFTLKDDQLSFCAHHLQIKAGQTFGALHPEKSTNINSLEPQPLAAIPWQLF